MRLRLHLAPRDPFALRERADAASDPSSPVYGRHLDRSALAAEVALAESERRALFACFESHGMRVTPDHGALGGQRVHLDATVAQLEATLGAAAAGALVARRYLPPQLCREALPHDVSGYVQAVTAAHEGERTVAPLPSSTQPLPPRVGGVTPADIARGYGFDATTSGRGETLAIMAFGGLCRLDDLHGFWRAHGIPAPEVEFVAVGPLGARATDPLCRFETTMAVQWAGAMSPGARIVVYLIDPSRVADPWSELLFAVLSDSKRAPTIAVTTWSCPERQYYAVHGGELVRGLLDQAALLGVTVIAASGDWGACDGMPGLRKDGSRVCEAPWPGVAFPAAEERVLAVGGTQVRALSPWHELAWSAPVSPALREAIGLDMLAGGGGFSAHVAVPAWQRAALAPAHPVVPCGRGVPDVALMAWGPDVVEEGGATTPAAYECVLDGVFRSDAGGTSTAAPIWASIIARMNETRRGRGLGRVGFAQPLLYEFAGRTGAFRAITEGATDIDLPVLDGHGAITATRVPGYRAHEGWNPATGLGVPRVATLRQIAGNVTEKELVAR